ncbi:MAG: triose-phosphate isomerase [Candidatus Methanomethylophilaceae archaeon]|nr:triose-phosphate isomerase [Candidatus Methanomethylophilaceae archaeon]
MVVNFKAYQEVDGEGSLRLAKICEDVAKESGVNIAVCPPMVELGSVARAVSIPVFSQNADPHAPGSATGWITASMIRSTGSVGTLINHSEHRSDNRTIEESVELIKAEDLITIVCAESVRKAREVAAFSPDFIAVEPPELIGGDISVTTANPLIVEDTVSSVKDVNKKISVLCGAGVKTGKDVAKALELGADGVLLASGVVKSKDPKATLQDLIKYI